MSEVTASRNNVGRRLAAQEVERVKTLMEQGMSPVLARAEVLGEEGEL